MSFNPQSCEGSIHRARVQRGGMTSSSMLPCRPEGEKG